MDLSILHEYITNILNTLNILNNFFFFANEGNNGLTTSDLSGRNSGNMTFIRDSLRLESVSCNVRDERVQYLTEQEKWFDKLLLQISLLYNCLFSYKFKITFYACVCMYLSF